MSALIECGDSGGFGRVVYPGYWVEGLRSMHRDRNFHPDRDERGEFDVEQPHIVDLAALFPDRNDPARSGLVLGDQAHRLLFISAEGVVSLGGEVDGYVPELGLDRWIPVDGDEGEPVATPAHPVIAPFGSAISTTLCPAPEGLHWSNTVHVCEEPGRLVVTWLEVFPESGPCGLTRRNRAKPAVTFQLELDGKERHGDLTVRFRYGQCDWMDQTPLERRGWAAIRRPDTWEPLARIGNLARPFVPPQPPNGMAPTDIPDAVHGLDALCHSSNRAGVGPGIYEFDIVAGQPDNWPSRANDRDQDGHLDEADNCPDTPNLGQADQDGDGVGDVCDDDTDGDGIGDELDNCPDVFNPDQANMAGDFSFLRPNEWRWHDVEDARPPIANDREGDACDGDIDGDGIPNIEDGCPELWSAEPSMQLGDLDGDGWDDYCDLDIDGDGIDNKPLAGPRALGVPRLPLDNCITVPNRSQRNIDGDSMGDACDPDRDNDEWPNCVRGPCIISRGLLVLGFGDNCPDAPNRDQRDQDGDGIGDACEGLSGGLPPNEVSQPWAGFGQWGGL